MGAFSFLLTLFVLNPAQESIHSYKIESALFEVTEFRDSFVVAPQLAAMSGNQLYLLDRGTSLVWSLSFDGKVIDVFGGEGQGPGELQKLHTGLHFYQDKLHITHNWGYRMEVFSNQGRFLEKGNPAQGRKIILAFGGHVWYTDNKEPEVVHWQVDGDLKESFHLNEAHPEDTFSHYLAAVADPFVLIANASGIQNRVYWLLLDVRRGELLEHQQFELLMRTEKSDYPANIPANAKFQPATLRSLTGTPRQGFLFAEATINPNKYPGYLFLRHLDPSSGTIKTIKLSHQGFENPYTLLPVEANVWLIGGSGKFGLYKVIGN